MRFPTRLHVTWQDANAFRMDTDFGTQTRVFHFGDWKSPGGTPSWQGDSVGDMGAAAGARSAEFAEGTGAEGRHHEHASRVPAQERRPYSAQATLTQVPRCVSEPDGDMMIVTTIVEDPVYLYNPLIVASGFQEEPNGAKWDPNALLGEVVTANSLEK